MFERLVMAEKTRQCLCLCFSMASGQFGAKINSSSGPRFLGKDNERDYSGKQLTLTPFPSSTCNAIMKDLTQYCSVK